MENALQFTEAENRIRNKWLFWSVKFPGVLWGLLVIVVTFGIFVSEKAVGTSIFIEVASILFASLVVVGGFYMNYYCAYKNPGTTLLLLLMVVVPLNMLFDLFKMEGLVFMSMTFCFELILLYYSYKLRKINKEMQNRELATSPLYMKALSVLSAANNLEELNEQFANLKVSYDSEILEDVLSKAYKQQKKALKIANSRLKESARKGD